MSDPEESDGQVYDLDRLIVFSDGVFAIVITLLILPLTAEVDLPGRDLSREAWGLWPRALSFLITFMVVGRFWVVHHRMYGRLLGCDAMLLWLSLVTLMTVCFMPFPAALLGEHSTAVDRFPVVLYAASLTLTSLMFTLTWFYALRHQLVDLGEGTASSSEHSIRSVVTTAGTALSIPVALLGLWPAVTCWVLVVPVARRVAVRWQRSHGATA